MGRHSFSGRLLRWFDQQRRDLPWRRTSDPWAIWVSEVMLQQTRVGAVVDSYERFMRRYPQPVDFAGVSDDELQQAWQGLGYYRRARLLRDGARSVVAEHDGKLPADAPALGALPGIGDYTKGAVGSIAFGLPLPAIDGNVERVTARHLALRTNVKLARTRRSIHAAVQGWLDHDRPGDFNQAMMELGAVICMPRSPRCPRCPIAGDCAARAEGIAAELPVRPAPRTTVAVNSRAIVAHRGAGVLAFRVPDGEPNSGQLELPGPGILQSVDPTDIVARTRQRCGARFKLGPELATVRHAITHHRITLTAHAGVTKSRRLQALPADDPTVPWTVATRKLFGQITGLLPGLLLLAS